MNTTQTVDYTLDKLKPVFDKLAEMGTAGWQMAVKQQLIVGYTALALVLFKLVVIIGLCVLTRHLLKRPVPEGESRWVTDDMPRAPFVTLLIASMASLTWVLATMANAEYIVGHLLNPSWYAIQALMELVR